MWISLPFLLILFTLVADLSPGMSIVEPKLEKKTISICVPWFPLKVNIFLGAMFAA